jgi:hypothetical protein
VRQSTCNTRKCQLKHDGKKKTDVEAVIARSLDVLHVSNDVVYFLRERINRPTNNQHAKHCEYPPSQLLDVGRTINRPTNKHHVKHCESSSWQLLEPQKPSPIKSQILSLKSTQLNPPPTSVRLFFVNLEKYFDANVDGKLSLLILIITLRCNTMGFRKQGARACVTHTPALHIQTKICCWISERKIQVDQNNFGYPQFKLSCWSSHLTSW